MFSFSFERHLVVSSAAAWHEFITLHKTLFKDPSIGVVLIFIYICPYMSYVAE